MKESFAEKMARKAFDDPKFQQSWQVHMGAFGPVLESSFREDCTARVHLCAALNHISRRESDAGAKKLELLIPRCKTETDRAAVAFFYGLSHQMAGEETAMIVCYREAVDLGLRFYIPFMKLAKVYQGWLMYDKAAKYYRGAIACFDGMGLGAGEKVILGSAYAGLATCLTMMHRYSDAERTLETSRVVCPDGPGRSAVEAILYAVLGKREAAQTALQVLLTHAPQVYEQTRSTVRRILAGEEPMFCEMEPDPEKLGDFWVWFAQNEDSFTEDVLNERYNALFPEAEGELRVELSGGCIRFPDHYIAALTRLCRELLACCPQQLRQRWTFESVRYLE